MTESPHDTTHLDDLVGGTPGNDRADGGARDTELTTDDAAQRDGAVERPGNTSD